MTLLSILGDVGTGKTLLATMLVSNEKRPVLSNYKIKIPTWKDLKPEMLNAIKEPSVVILDEAYTWLESRRSGTPLHIYMSHILFQSRKLGLDFILTDQIEGVIDTRYRQMINYTILCQVYPEIGFNYTVFQKGVIGYCEPFDFTLPFEVAELFYPLYDSWERVSAIDERMMFEVSSDKSETIDRIDELADEILTKADGKRVTQGVISDYILRKGEPAYMGKLVYNAVKRKSMIPII